MAETSINDLVTEYKTNYETELNTVLPVQPRAFLPVMSVQEAVCHKGIEKRITAAQKAVFAVTAGADGLAVLGNEFGVPRVAAVKYQATCVVVSDPGKSVTAGAELTSEASGAYYKVNATENEAGGFITFAVTAEDSGDAPNLEVGYPLTFVTPIAGVDAESTITVVDVYGAEQEDLEVWRARVLEAERAAYGGGNAADYRHWGIQPTGVAQVYPYSGKPITWKLISDLISFDHATNAIIRDTTTKPWGVGTLGVGDMIEVSGSDLNDGFYTVQNITGVDPVLPHITVTVVENITDEAQGDLITIVNQSLPGDRTVFVEAANATRIPTTPLLDLVRAAIDYGTDGEYQPALGDTDSTLYVEPVTTAKMYIQVMGLIIADKFWDQCKTKVVEDLETYFNSCRPFIEGLDFEMDRRDVISDLSVGKVVQGVLETYSAYCDGVRISVGSAGYDTLTSYMLNQGEVPVLTLVWDTTSGPSGTGDPDWGA